jgi:hypothetical protein
MKPASLFVVAASAVLSAMGAASAADLKDQMKIEIRSSEEHAGMPAGTYVCAAGHLHVKVTVQNLADVPVPAVEVAGKALDAEGKVVGTATASTRQREVGPKESAPIDMEFESVTGPLIKQVKSEQLTVVSVGPKP